MKPTLVPAPVMPSERAVFADGSVESACMVPSASGVSSGAAPGAGQEPGTGLTVGAVGAAAALTGEARWMIWSGTTSATSGDAASRCCSPADTVAATALMVVYDRTLRALVLVRSARTGFWICATACRRALTWARLAGNCPSWFLNTTITRCVTPVDSALAWDAERAELLVLELPGVGWAFATAGMTRVRDSAAAAAVSLLMQVPSGDHDG